VEAGDWVRWPPGRQNWAPNDGKRRGRKCMASAAGCGPPRTEKGVSRTCTGNSRVLLCEHGRKGARRGWRISSATMHGRFGMTESISQASKASHRPRHHHGPHPLNRGTGGTSEISGLVSWQGPHEVGSMRSPLLLRGRALLGLDWHSIDDGTQRQMYCSAAGLSFNVTRQFL